MAYTNLIAVIDLGSSHMVGMVGTKGASGALSILAYEVENSDNCMRRGCVYNIKDTAAKIRKLILKLDNSLKEGHIGKVYIGVGGQSLRTVNHVVSRVLGSGEVTEQILDEMYRECCQYRPELLDVLHVASPVYYLDNNLETDPQGMAGSRIEAHYRLVVGRPSLRNSVTTNMTDQIKVDVAGVIVSPIALSDLILTDQEKEKGCVLVDFGAGVTSVTIYKNGKLAALSVIPLGSNLITRDLMTLNLSEEEAERVKRTYGNAIWDKDSDQQVASVDQTGVSHATEMKLSDINRVVEARIREIIENVYARVADAGFAKEPGFSVVIAGNGVALKNLREAVSERFGMSVRYASVRKGGIEIGEMIANNPLYTTATALLLKGTVNCFIPVQEQPKEIVKEVVKEVIPPVAPVEPVVVPQEEPKVTVKEPVVETPPVKPKETKEAPDPAKNLGKNKKSGWGFRSLFDDLADKVGTMVDSADDK